MGWHFTWGAPDSSFRVFFFAPASEIKKSANKSTVCILGALKRQVDLQGAFVKIGDFIKFKGFLVEFLESRRS